MPLGATGTQARVFAASRTFGGDGAVVTAAAGHVLRDVRGVFPVAGATQGQGMRGDIGVRHVGGPVQRHAGRVRLYDRFSPDDFKPGVFLLITASGRDMRLPLCTRSHQAGTR